jgi:beta-lactamase class A
MWGSIPLETAGVYNFCVPRFVFILLLATAFAGAANGPVAVDVGQLLEQKQAAKIKAIDESMDGVLGVATIDLTTGRVFTYHGDAVFPTASSIKIPIMIRVFRDVRAGKLTFAEKITMGPKDNAGGSGGPLQKALDRGPVTITVRDLVEDMIQYSDNSATNKLIDLVGMNRVNALIREFGLEQTRLRRKMMDTAAAARGDENVSTPLEMARIVRLIYSNQAADPESCRDMLDIMKRVDAYMRPMIPDNIEVASKPGDLDGVRTETGVVFVPKRPFVISVMSTYLDHRVNPVGKVTAVVFDFFNKLAHANQYGRRLD